MTDPIDDDAQDVQADAQWAVTMMLSAGPLGTVYLVPGHENGSGTPLSRLMQACVTGHPRARPVGRLITALAAEILAVTNMAASAPDTDDAEALLANAVLVLTNLREEASR